MSLTTSITVKKGAEVVFKSTNEFGGLTQAEEASLIASAKKNLGLAQRNQSAGSDWTIIWQWGTEPPVETKGLPARAVTWVMFQSAEWLRQRAINAHERIKAGKQKPWG